MEAAQARIAELEATVADLRARLAKRNHNSLERLQAYNAAHPDAAAARVKRYQERNREAYNARRRELRRLKRSGGAGAGEPPTAVNPPGAAAAQPSTHGGETAPPQQME
jgi:hypothetical protein